MTILWIILSMFAMGLLLGFVGAGGSGFMIAILTVIFKVDIHLAMGTALAAMMFTSLSGAVSHFREQNVDLASGVIVGLTGAVGAWFGSTVAFSIPAEIMTWCTAGMLTLSSLVLWLRLTILRKLVLAVPTTRGVRFILTSSAIGAATGFLSGTFGIGSTPFIQVGLMLLLGLPIRLAAGTTMLVILPIAASAGVGYYYEGSLDTKLLLAVLAGSMTGSYAGAKLTKRAPASVLKFGMVATPIAAACLLLI